MSSSYDNPATFIFNINEIISPRPIARTGLLATYNSPNTRLAHYEHDGLPPNLQSLALDSNRNEAIWPRSDAEYGVDTSFEATQSLARSLSLMRGHRPFDYDHLPERTGRATSTTTAHALAASRPRRGSTLPIPIFDVATTLPLPISPYTSRVLTDYAEQYGFYEEEQTGDYIFDSDPLADTSYTDHLDYDDENVSISLAQRAYLSPASFATLTTDHEHPFSMGRVASFGDDSFLSDNECEDLLAAPALPLLRAASPRTFFGRLLPYSFSEPVTPSVSSYQWRNYLPNSLDNFEAPSPNLRAGEPMESPFGGPIDGYTADSEGSEEDYPTRRGTLSPIHPLPDSEEANDFFNFRSESPTPTSRARRPTPARDAKSPKPSKASEPQDKQTAMFPAKLDSIGDASRVGALSYDDGMSPNEHAYRLPLIPSRSSLSPDNSDEAAYSAANTLPPIRTPSPHYEVVPTNPLPSIQELGLFPINQPQVRVPGSLVGSSRCTGMSLPHHRLAVMYLL